MLRHVRKRPSSVPRASLALAMLVATVCALAGCGSGAARSDDAHANVDTAAHAGCASTALHALRGVARRVYHEGIFSERTVTAMRIVEASAPLRTAIERGDTAGVLTAAQALLATGHLTDLRVVRGGQVLVDLGGAAVAPLNGTVRDAARKPLASFQTSVWADSGLLAEVNGIAGVQAALRDASTQSNVAGSAALPSGALPPQGTFTHNGVAYQFTSFATAAYPAGAPLRMYLMRTISSTAPLCGSSDEQTTFNTVRHIARLIYYGETGRRTLTQMRRVQGNAPLLAAVARRDPVATRKAVQALLNQHIVRMRVSAGGRLLSDVGGPYVLAPVTGPLRLGGRTIGSVVLSIQDDEGYKRLAGRLAGLDVVMYMGSRLVKSTLGPSPGAIPTSGTVHLRGKSFRAYTFKAAAFPSGPLRITVLIPMPYS